MDIRWQFSKRDIREVQELVRFHRKDFFVSHRIARNLRGNRPGLTPSRCWHALLMCLLTTQQRSGPDSPIQRVLTSRPFVLKLGIVKKKRNPSRFLAKTLRSYGGIRRVDTIGVQAAENLPWFSGSEWRELKRQLISLNSSRGYSREREVANWLANEFRGLGPKQSRNFLQCLGLTRYEIPIDSRITKWLNEFGFPVVLNAASLSDPYYFAFVNDGVRELCKAAGTFPCVLDAVVFSRVDGGGWTDRNLVF